MQPFEGLTRVPELRAFAEAMLNKLDSTGGGSRVTASIRLHLLGPASTSSGEHSILWLEMTFSPPPDGNGNDWVVVGVVPSTTRYTLKREMI